MTRALLRATPLLAAAALTAACATASRSRTEPVAVCDTGRAVLVVRNDSAREVEIVESRIGSGALVVVGLVPTGRQELPIRNEPGYSYHARVPGSRAVLASSSQRPFDSRSVTLERTCRS